jgi:hypothetical protein
MKFTLLSILAFLAFTNTTYAASCTGDLYRTDPYREVQRKVITYCSDSGKEHGFCTGQVTQEELQGWRSKCAANGGKVRCGNSTDGTVVSTTECDCTKRVTELMGRIQGEGEYLYEAQASFQEAYKNLTKSTNCDDSYFRCELKNYGCR